MQDCFSTGFDLPNSLGITIAAWGKPERENHDAACDETASNRRWALDSVGHIWRNPRLCVGARWKLSAGVHAAGSVDCYRGKR